MSVKILLIYSLTGVVTDSLPSLSASFISFLSCLTGLNFFFHSLLICSIFFFVKVTFTLPKNILLKHSPTLSSGYLVHPNVTYRDSLQAFLVSFALLMHKSNLACHKCMY